MNDALTAEEFVVIILALDMLLKHTEAEATHARRNKNNRKHLALLIVRKQIVQARLKIARIREAYQ